MSVRVQYRTQQREELLAYLRSVPGRHVTVADICDYLREQGRPVGTSTIYRHLERMVDEGLVNKYTIDSSSPACFEYIADKTLCGPDVCFHCKCEKCGRLIHLHCGELESLGEHLRSEHGFVMDPRRTVFYGLCEACAKDEKQEDMEEL